MTFPKIQQHFPGPTIYLLDGRDSVDRINFREVVFHVLEFEDADFFDFMWNIIQPAEAENCSARLADPININD